MSLMSSEWAPAKHRFDPKLRVRLLSGLKRGRSAVLDDVRIGARALGVVDEGVIGGERVSAVEIGLCGPGSGPDQRVELLCTAGPE